MASRDLGMITLVLSLCLAFSFATDVAGPLVFRTNYFGGKFLTVTHGKASPTTTVGEILDAATKALKVPKAYVPLHFGALQIVHAEVKATLKEVGITAPNVKDSYEFTVGHA